MDLFDVISNDIKGPCPGCWPCPGPAAAVTASSWRKKKARSATSTRPCCRKDCCRWPLRCAEDCASRDSTHPAHGRPLGLPFLQQNTNHRE